VVRDFSGNPNMEFYDKICAEFEDILPKIGLVVLNAGTVTIADFDETSGKYL
jgi:hypothetical protein